MFFIIKVFDWTIAQVAVRPTVHLLQQTFQVPIRKATFIFKISTFLFIIQKNDGFFLRCQDTISVPKIRYAVSYIACFASLQDLHYRNLHFGPACICDAKHFIKYAIVIGKWGRMFLSLCHTPPSFSPIRNHICTLIKILLRFQ